MCVSIMSHVISHPHGWPRPEPPWEASFLRALRKLEPLRRNLQFRRQGTALTVTSRPKRCPVGPSGPRYWNWPLERCWKWDSDVVH